MINNNKKDKEILEEWGRMHEWYRQYRASKRRRQQDVKRKILIPWYDYSKGIRWL